MSKTLLKYEEAKKRRGENLLPHIDEEDEKILDHAWVKAGCSQFDDVAAYIHFELTRAPHRVSKK